MHDRREEEEKKVELAVRLGIEQEKFRKKFAEQYTRFLNGLIAQGHKGIDIPQWVDTYKKNKTLTFPDKESAKTFFEERAKNKEQFIAIETEPVSGAFFLSLGEGTLYSRKFAPETMQRFVEYVKNGYEIPEEMLQSIKANDEHAFTQLLDTAIQEQKSSIPPSDQNLKTRLSTEKKKGQALPRAHDATPEKASNFNPPK